MSITNDLLGDAILFDRDVSGLLLLRCGLPTTLSLASVCMYLEPIGNDGPARGSGDVSRLVYDMLRGL